MSQVGGHGFAISLGKLAYGIEIDLSNFKNVSVDVKANTMTVGGAVRIREILGPLGEAHKELPNLLPCQKYLKYVNDEQAIGSQSCVGMVGTTLGVGVGRYNGLHGMLLDSLVSVRMAIAAGNIVTASAMENPELFWGIRGAGFNYGTMLEATYSLYDETAPLVLNADFLFAPKASQAILEYFKTFGNSLPAKLSFIVLATYSPTMGGVSLPSV